MPCRSAEHLVHAIMPSRSIPTPDSVVYNDSIFSRNAQENRAFARFLVFLRKTPCNFYDGRSTPQYFCSYFFVYVAQFLRRSMCLQYRWLWQLRKRRLGRGHCGCWAWCGRFCPLCFEMTQWPSVRNWR